MSFRELRRECDRDGIGPLLWDLLVRVSGRMARRYPPALYNDGQSWSEEAIRDLAQQVAVERLLAEHQLEYVLELAEDEDSLAKLLSFQVRRALSHRRATTVVDRLATRVRTLIQSAPYESTTFGTDTWVSLVGTDRAARSLSDTELRQGARSVASIPRIPSSATASRESKVYSANDLNELVRRLVSEFGGITLRDVRKILDIALTAWLPTILREAEEDQVSGSSPEQELERSHMEALVQALVSGLDPVHRVVLLGKSQGVSDGDLALRVGRSRPWIADRKAEVLGLVESDLIAELQEEFHAEAIRRLIEELSELEGELE